MKSTLAMCILCSSLNTVIAAHAGMTDKGFSTTGHQTSVFAPGGTTRTVTSTSVTDGTTKSRSSSEQTLQFIDTVRTRAVSQFPELNTDAGNNTMPQNVTYNMTVCAQNPHSHPVTIKGTNGHVIFKSVHENQYDGCEIILQVPTDKVVHLQIDTCTFIDLVIIDDEAEEDILYAYCRTDTDRYVVYSQTDKVSIFLSSSWIPGKQFSELSLYFSAVDKSQRPSLELYYLTQYSGYLQTPGWNETAPYPPFMKSCITLTPPTDHVVFVGLLRMDIHHREDQILVFPGHCQSKPNYHDTCWSHASLHKPSPAKCLTGGLYPEAFLFPDDFLTDGQKKELPQMLSFHFSSNVRAHLSGFRLRFSFHSSDLKPRRVQHLEASDDVMSRGAMYMESVDGMKWNCTVSVWPDLLEHFPCDLISQCAESEDEAHCAYASEKCGINQVQAGNKCFIYEKQRYISWFDSDKKCRQQSAVLASLETHQEWKDVTELLEHSLTMFTWIGLKTTRKDTRKNPMNAL